MHPTIKLISGFKFIGKSKPMRSVDGLNFKEIPIFWEEFMDAQAFKDIPNKANINLLGVCANWKEQTREFDYIIGSEVTSLDVIPDGMTALEIPGGTYASFLIKGDEIPASITYIFQEWLPKSGYKHGMTPEIEVYDERWMSEEPVMEFLLPVKK